MKHMSYLCLESTHDGQAPHTHVHEIIKGLRQRGWRVRLFHPSYSRWHGAPAIPVRLFEFVRIQLRLWLNGRPDVLYIRWHFASWPTALWARLRGIPVVQEVNGWYQDLFAAWPWTRYFRRLFVALMRWQLRWADAVITVTPKLGKWVKNEVNGRHVRIAVVPNGANTDLFNPNVKPDPGLQLPVPYVIFFGTLARWQGIDTILAAVDHPAWPQKVNLVVVGDGVERAKVEAAARRSPRVQYLGRQPYTRVPGLVAGSLAALSPKVVKSDHSPLKVYEALACGVPVVVTDFPGMADVVRDGNCGLVIPPEDSEALANAVNYLYRHPEVRVAMGKRGRFLVETKHSWDHRAEETAKVLEDVLRSAKGHNGKELSL